MRVGGWGEEGREGERREGGGGKDACRAVRKEAEILRKPLEENARISGRNVRKDDGAGIKCAIILPGPRRTTCTLPAATPDSFHWRENHENPANCGLFLSILTLSRKAAYIFFLPFLRLSSFSSLPNPYRITIQSATIPTATHQSQERHG
ncbi:hypothetical protein E2C01_036302 [Portunus trituberculatus]|uniref:Uncharacterized protein n=1 Tax=Portunus trituberculatus TaxID=210409 RepID=A0A5B7FB05_PORTR|nr:hypothetical protein [Portunus trituberculatus]